MLRLIALALLSAAARCRRLKQVGFRAALVPAVAWGGARPAVAAAIALTALGAAAAAQATTYPVSTTAQLEAAIAASNAGPGEDTINVAPGVYAPSGVLLITDDLTINGGGRPGSVIEGNGSHDVLRVVTFPDPVYVTFNDLTIRKAL